MSYLVHCFPFHSWNLDACSKMLEILYAWSRLFSGDFGIWFANFAFLDCEIWCDLHECDNVCHTKFCPTSWILFPYFCYANCSEFLHVITSVCLVWAWFFVDFLDSFPIWLGFSLLFSHLWTFVECSTYMTCEILMPYHMKLKFCGLILNMFKFILALVWFIYLMPFLFYTCLKLIIDLMPCMSLYV